MTTDCAIVILSEDGTRQETFLSSLLKENEWTSDELEQMFGDFFAHRPYLVGGGATPLVRIYLDGDQE